MSAKKYELWDYCDVWGNEDDGYEVNGRCKVEENIVIDNEEATNDTIIEFLKTIGYLVNDCSIDDFYILWDSEEYIEIYAKESGIPLCCFIKHYDYK